MYGICRQALSLPQWGHASPLTNSDAETNLKGLVKYFYHDLAIHVLCNFGKGTVPLRTSDFSRQEGLVHVPRCTFGLCSGRVSVVSYSQVPSSVRHPARVTRGVC